MFPDEPTTNYHVAMPTADWDAWKATVPRDMALYERLHMLVRADTAAGGVARGDVDGWDDEDEQMVRLLASRVLHRARRAETALKNDDTDRVAEELATIIDIAAELDA
jgi:hypothetical protein